MFAVRAVIPEVLATGIIRFTLLPPFLIPPMMAFPFFPNHFAPAQVVREGVIGFTFYQKGTFVEQSFPFLVELFFVVVVPGGPILNDHGASVPAAW